MSARREKRLRVLERRVEALEAIAATPVFIHTQGDGKEDCVLDALWTRAPERGPVPGFSVETARRSLWDRLVEFFKKGV